MNSEFTTDLVYLANVSVLEDDELFSSLLPLVDEKRREKTLRYKHKKDRLLSLGAGLLTKKILIQAGAEDAILTYAPSGMPVIESDKELHISISHSGEMVMVVLSSSPCGCDIEKTDIRHMAVSSRFTEEEKDALEHCDDAQRAELFTELWTRKEAYAKCKGISIHQAVSKNCLFPENSFSESDDAEGIRITALYAADGYKASICTASDRVAEVIYAYLDTLF